MSLFDKLFNRKTTTTDVTFKKVAGEAFTLGNQNGQIENPSKNDLQKYLDLLFTEDDQFIVLTLERAKNGIRYVQATFAGNELIVQLGLEEGETTRLVEKTCPREAECTDIFYRFYDYGMVEHLEEYKPVEF